MVQVLAGPPALTKQWLTQYGNSSLWTGWQHNLPEDELQIVALEQEADEWTFDPLGSAFNSPAGPPMLEVVRDLLGMRDAGSLLEAMRAREQTANAATAPIWQELIFDHERSISRYRPFEELKAIYDGLPRGEDTARVRALDAMCFAGYRPAAAVARTVLREANDFDSLPAALRCILAFSDHDALPLLVKILPSLLADEVRRSAETNALEPDWRLPYEASKAYSARLRHDRESGRSGASFALVHVFVCLASLEDLPLALRLLQADEWSARPLAEQYFSRFPTPAALPIVRDEAAAAPSDWDHRGLKIALALLGDPEVVTWALGVHGSEDDRILANEVIASSPLPAAHGGVAPSKPPLRPIYCGPP
jgi:hypothetical protein